MKISIMGFVCVDIVDDGNFEYTELGGSAGNVASILKNMDENVFVWFPHYTGEHGRYLEKILEKNKIRIVQFANTANQAPSVRITYNGAVEQAKYTTRDRVTGKVTSRVYLPTVNQVFRHGIELQETQFLYTDRMSTGIHKAIDIVNDLGGWIMYEPNGCRAYDSFYNNVNCADIVKFSCDKVFPSFIERMCADKRKSRLKIIIITQGRRGVRFCCREEDGSFSEWKILEAPKVERVIDSTGAGDWMSAVFIKKFLEKFPTPQIYDHVHLKMKALEEILMEAQMKAAEACGFRGVWKEHKKVKM